MVGGLGIGGLGAALARAGRVAGQQSGSGGAAGIGTIAGIVLLLPMEAGVPIPIPADLVMLAVGARVGAGGIALWAAVLAFEAVAVVGTTALFAAARGPGNALVRRLGPRIGLTAARQARAAGLIERRGWPALALLRATPGLRTLTVVAAGGSGLSPRRALPPLIAGSSVFLQLHLFLGYFLGTAAQHVLHVATGPALAAAAVLVLGAAAFWLVRRGRRAGAGSLAEAACPACLTLALLAERPAEVRAVAVADPASGTAVTDPAPGPAPDRG
jgi:membrane protein DedA with SNARE-associated domain